jgi:diaminopimelate epimerase
MRFTKFQGFGNDYIVFEATQLSNVTDLGSFARRICNRHYGAGADGIAVVSEPPASAGGSQSDFRCAFSILTAAKRACRAMARDARQLIFSSTIFGQLDELRLQTRNGIKRYHLLSRENGKFLFRSELGQPRFDSASIPMSTPQALDRVIDFPLVVDEQTLKVTAMQMGNPNCCIFVDDFNELDWRRLGPLIENHRQFPERTNVIFIRVRDRANIEERIWERGVGETESSGTCSCAAAVASVINGKTDRHVNVHAPGGLLPIEWRDDGEVVLTGRAEVVYNGDWLSE